MIYLVDFVLEDENQENSKHMISEVRLIGFLFNGCLVTNQPQSVLKMFLNFYISNTSTTQKCPYGFTVEKSIIQ